MTKITANILQEIDQIKLMKDFNEKIKAIDRFFSETIHSLEISNDDYTTNDVKHRHPAYRRRSFVYVTADHHFLIANFLIQDTEVIITASHD